MSISLVFNLKIKKILIVLRNLFDELRPENLQTEFSANRFTATSAITQNQRALFYDLTFSNELKGNVQSSEVLTFDLWTQISPNSLNLRLIVSTVYGDRPKCFASLLLETRYSNWKCRLIHIITNTHTPVLLKVGLMWVDESCFQPGLSLNTAETIRLCLMACKKNNVSSRDFDHVRGSQKL